MRAEPLFCQRCGRGRRAHEYGCPSCGTAVYAAGLPTSITPEPLVLAPLGGVLDLVAVPPGSLVLLHGDRGIGKSTVAMQALNRPWMASSEMDATLVLAYANRLGVSLAGVSRPTWTGSTVALGVTLNPWTRVWPDFVLDSATATGHDVDALYAARMYVVEHDAVGIVVTHETKAGAAWGAATLGHEVDVVVRLEAEGAGRRVVVEKNRFGALGSRRFDVGAAGVIAPKYDRYYSVEGRLGRYYLAPHPSPDARYADYLRAAERAVKEDDERLRLPAPPAAVAVQRAELYGGWIEPPDSADREAFAASVGVPYYSPPGASHGH